MDYSPYTTLTPEQEKQRREAQIVDALMAQSNVSQQPQDNGGRFATPTSGLNVLAEMAQAGAKAYRGGQLGRPQPGTARVVPAEQPGYIDPMF